MDIKEAIIALENKTNVLIDKDGNRYQRNSDCIMVIFNKETRTDNTVASGVNDKEFIRKHLDHYFDLDVQWYQKSLTFPILCRVRCPLWRDYKIVCFNSKSGNWFQTGFGESYTPSYNTEITPLTDDEIESFKRGFGVVEVKKMFKSKIVVEK